MSDLVGNPEDRFSRVAAHSVTNHHNGKVKVGNDQEKTQSERNSHSTNLGVGKTKMTFRYLYQENIS